jgi:hypothetical protein
VPEAQKEENEPGPKSEAMDTALSGSNMQARYWDLVTEVKFLSWALSMKWL